MQVGPRPVRKVTYGTLH